MHTSFLPFVGLCLGGAAWAAPAPQITPAPDPSFIPKTVGTCVVTTTSYAASFSIGTQIFTYCQCSSGLIAGTQLAVSGSSSTTLCATGPVTLPGWTQVASFATPVAAAPSNHPSATTNEFKYQNFDRTDAKQAGDMDMIHYAFAGLGGGDNWHSLAGAALSVIGDSSDDTFSNWFPDKVTAASNMDARIYVGGVFRRLYNPPVAQARISNLVADQTDFGTNAKCNDNSGNPTVKAYIQPDTGRFHICQLGLDQPMVPDVANCSSLGDKVSKAMRSLSSTELHEMMHWKEIGTNAPSSIGRIIDVRGAYDPGVCYGMAHAKSDSNRQKSFINDNNYMYLALNAYYNGVCKKKFGPPDLPSAQDEADDEAECDALGDLCDGADGVNLGTYNN